MKANLTGSARMQSSRSARASQWLLALCVGGSALAVGTVHTPTLCVVVTALGAAAVLAWWGAEPIRVRPAATLLLFAGLVLTLYTVVQCFPLPRQVLAALAPHNADVWSRALSPMHEPGPSWAPLTLDPYATRVEVLKGIGYLLAFVAALRVARRREGARFLSGAIVLTGLVLAAAALLHPAFGAHRLFGIYEPASKISERHIAPLMNPNNLAGYLNVALCLALASIFTPEPPVPRSISATVVLVLGATQLWIASRGGVVAMMLGASLVIAIARLREGTPAATAMQSFLTGLFAVAGAMLIVLGGSDDASKELLQTDVSKLTMFMRTMRMLPAVPFFGCGRGAFESAFPAFRSGSGYVTMAYPENVVAQWILEWGLPFGLAGLVTVAWALKPSAVLARSATASGAWAAVVALTAQNLGDLASEIPGVVFAGAVCAAIVVAGTPGHRSRWRVEHWGGSPSVVAVVAAAATVGGVIAAVTGLGHELHDDQGALYEAAMDHHVSSRVMRGVERAAMLRHPAEPYLPFAAALKASTERNDNVIPWIAATFERASVYGPAHLILAHSLAKQAPAQARMEYRLAMEQEPELDVAAMREAPRLVSGYFEAMELVPSGKEGDRVLEMLAGAVDARLPATRVRLDASLAARTATLPGPAMRAARDAVDDVDVAGGAPWCDSFRIQQCAREAVEKANRLAQIKSDRCYPYALRARARVAAGEKTLALKELQAAVDVVSDRIVCLQALEETALASGDRPLAQATLEQIVRAGCNDDESCAKALGWAASQQEASGSRGAALALYKRAHDRVPDDDTFLQNVARLAAETGRHAEAADAYDDLGKHHPTDPRWSTAAAEERRAALRSTLKL